MQMCADIFHQEVIVPQIDNVPARGAAACAAVAVGKECGYPGCMDFEESSARLIPGETLVYRPDGARGRLYDELYCYYGKLHDVFGRDDSFMKGLRNIGKSRNV